LERKKRKSKPNRPAPATGILRFRKRRLVAAVEILLKRATKTAAVERL
jgi:hypothetical protein